jgi:hypothetical protein
MVKLREGKREKEKAVGWALPTRLNTWLFTSKRLGKNAVLLNHEIDLQGWLRAAVPNGLNSAFL